MLHSSVSHVTKCCHPNPFRSEATRFTPPAPPTPNPPSPCKCKADFGALWRAGHSWSRRRAVEELPVEDTTPHLGLGRIELFAIRDMHSWFCDSLLFAAAHGPMSACLTPLFVASGVESLILMKGNRE